jgi:Na+-driven multidrug efflux pump
MALSTVLAPFIGQNWGANRIDRVRLAVKYSQGFSMIWGVAMLILFATFSRSIGNLFNDHPLIVENIVNYMWIVPLGYGLQGVLLLSNSTLNVLNKPMNAAGLVVFQAFVLQIPLAYLGSQFVGLTGIFSAIVVANIIAGFTAYWWLRHVLSRS